MEVGTTTGTEEVVVVVAEDEATGAMVVCTVCHSVSLSNLCAIDFCMSYLTSLTCPSDHDCCLGISSNKYYRGSRLFSLFSSVAVSFLVPNN